MNSAVQQYLLSGQVSSCDISRFSKSYTFSRASSPEFKLTGCAPRMVATIQSRLLGTRDKTFDIEPPILHAMRAEIESQDTLAGLKLPMKETALYSLCRSKSDKIISEMKTALYFLPSRINPAI